jgi:DNA (cytosine-5)-methyltransferase 1
MKHLSLLSGIGGIDLAAEWAGFESAIMVERDPYCQQVLKKNFPTTQIFDDVTTFNGLELRGTINLISAGFPCQPHSLAGKRKASGDERDLWGEVVRILGEVQPRWFLGENVPGLLSSESGRFFGRVVNDLDKMGYRMGWGMYGAKDVGAVHRRNRVFIVGYSKGKSSNGGGFAEQLCSESQAQESGSRTWKRISGGNWREWDTCPIVYETRSESRIRGKNDGVPHRVDRLKALGNAVVPQQIYPILEEMARLDREL